MRKTSRRLPWMICATVTCAILCAPARSRAANPADYFAIEVVDEQTGRGVPLAELTTTNQIKCITDSAGLVAFNEPGLMDQKVFFTVTSHGYEFPADGFGFHGIALETKPGGNASLKITRINIAERLY